MLDESAWLAKRSVIDKLWLKGEYRHIVTEENSLKRSPLHQHHVAEGGRIVPFAGWEMPVQFTGIAPEHRLVREKIGVFDISHMGELWVTGPKAATWLNSILTNQVDKLQAWEGQYTLLLNEEGGVVDDLILYKASEEEFLLVVNASKIDEDFEILNAAAVEGVLVENLSDVYAAVAVQGPSSREFFQNFFPDEVYPEKNRWSRGRGSHSDVGSYFCGTGYTGEEGFEWFAPVDLLREQYPQLVQTIRDLGGDVCGLGARDSLRLEMGYPLNGNDLRPDKTPLEAGLAFFVDMNKPSFIGKNALLAQQASGIPTRLTGFVMEGTSPPPRPHYAIYSEDERIGEICSGGLSPSLAKGIGIAYLPTGRHQLGSPIQVEIRGKRYPATTVRKPFYRKPTINEQHEQNS